MSKNKLVELAQYAIDLDNPTINILVYRGADGAQVTFSNEGPYTPKGRLLSISKARMIKRERESAVYRLIDAYTGEI